jgi:putative ABC transport system permease protein
MSNWIERFARRLRAVMSRQTIDAELSEEMRHHLALEAEDIARLTGVSPDEARRRAHIGFGGELRFREEHQDARGVRWMEHTLRDLRHAGRGLLRSPGFTISAVIVLALGVGSTTAVFSAVNAVLNNPAHDGLALVLYRGFPSLSTVDVRAIEEQQRSFTAVGAVRGGEAAFQAGGEPERIRVNRVTTGFFQALGHRAAAGRLIQPSDEPVGTAPVALLGHAFAARALGGAAAVGRTISLDGVSHTVVGVLAPGNEMFATRADVWTALQLATPTRRGPFGTMMIARLKPGVTYEAATRDLSAISERIFPLWSSALPDKNARYEAKPIRTTFLADSDRMLRLFGAAVAIVLLIGIANVASLMLVRAIARSHEVALRAVLGASRGQLVRLFAAESALLSVAGAVAGIAVGALGLRALIAIGPDMPGLTTAALDVRASTFAVAVAVVAGLVVGAYPVVMLLRKHRPGLASGARTVGGGRGATALRSAFVVSQFALALPLLATAGLLLISFARLQRVNPGFDPDNMVTARVSLPVGQYSGDTAIAAYWGRALARVREVPGVREAGLGGTMPPDDFGNSNDNFDLIDKPAAPGTAEPNGPWPSVDAGYFGALGIRLLEGRMFTPQDTSPGQAPSTLRPAVIVSRSWARKHYPEGSPLGKTMHRGGCRDCPLSEVVGVVDDVRYVGLAGPLDAMYSPLTEGWGRTLYVFVRTQGSPETMVEPVRAALRSVDPSVPLGDVATMENRLYQSMAQPRHWATLLGAFAITALGLAAIGIFGMLSYAVSMRKREIGVRMALGAGRQSVVRMVVGNGLTHAVIGSAVGLVAALAGARMLASADQPDPLQTQMLYGVSARDPATLALVTVVLLGVALFACWLPARRAATIDPLEAIRHE